VDIAEEASKVRSFAKNKGLSFPILLDTKGAVASQYGVRAHPVAYLIDMEGKVMGVARGFREWDRKEMKTLVSSLMSRTES
jgi:peroxiredoxin